MIFSLKARHLKWHRVANSAARHGLGQTALGCRAHDRVAVTCPDFSDHVNLG